MTREARPLAGVRVAVTRPTHSAPELADALRTTGAVPVLLPLTRIVAPLDDVPLRTATDRVEQYDWLIFTSANAVRAFSAVMDARRPAHRTRLAAVGRATADAIRALLMREPDVVPATFGGAALVRALQETDTLDAARVLWPRAEAADNRLGRALEAAGAALDAPVAYRTECSAEAAGELARLEQRGALDAITFTAPSAVECYAAASTGVTQCVVAVIGSTTGAAARARGIRVQVEPRQPIISALVAALARHYLEQPG